VTRPYNRAPFNDYLSKLELASDLRWTRQEEEILIYRWVVLGETATQIAKYIRKSRNAILGKVDRLHIHRSRKSSYEVDPNPLTETASVNMIHYKEDEPARSLRDQCSLRWFSWEEAA
jgi:hypothetical protein